MAKAPLAATKPVTNCPYCHSTRIVKRGLRVKKHETIQLYFCPRCVKKFTPLISKHKSFPLQVIIDTLTLYNRLHTLDEAARQTSEKYGVGVSRQNIAGWLDDFGDYFTFTRRMRDFVARKYDRRDVLVENRLFHGQIYDFKYHRAKTDLLIEEHFRHSRFYPLQQFLELVTAECPHQAFKESSCRASQHRDIFNLDKVKIVPKNNRAVKNAGLVLQAVANNKLRHQILQEFMIVNDSVTVACEVPILLDEEDIDHYRNQLGFEIPAGLGEFPLAAASGADGDDPAAASSADDLPDDDGKVSLCLDEAPARPADQKWLLTGHIDLLQIRNGNIHILDYKPQAAKAKPVDQLTLYALALSRLTGLRLFHFKCGWFDEKNYFEFFPLHVVYKKKKKKRGSFQKDTGGRGRKKRGGKEGAEGAEAEEGEGSKRKR